MEFNDKMTSSGNPPPYTANSGPTPAQPTQPAPQAVGVVVAGPVMMPMMYGQRMGREPASMVCKSCGVQIVTRLDMKSSTKTHICAGLLCAFGCWPCVPIPYCTNTCKNADHYCPHCNAYIGSYINML